MTKFSGNAEYLSNDIPEKTRIKNHLPIGRSVLVSVLMFSMALVMGLLTIQPNVTKAFNNDTQVSAWGFEWFGDKDKLGMNMDDRGAWKSPIQRYPSMDLSNRSWTAQELFGGNLKWPVYTGEGKGTDWTKDSGDRYKIKGEPSGVKKNKDKVEKQRNAATFIFGYTTTFLANGIISLSSILTTFAGNFATFAFDSSLICTDAQNPGSGCFNLLKVIGGTGDRSDGVIGLLTSSIYMPLLVLGVLITGLWVAYIGIWRRQIREAFFGAIWMTLAVIVGLMFLYNPALLAKAPMQVSNGVGACIIGAFNGQNCFSDSSSNSSELKDAEICKSDASTNSPDQKMTLAVNGMACQIWKAFVLEPYSQGSFGRSFDELTPGGKHDKVSQQLKDAGIKDPESTFKIYMTSSEKGEDADGKTIKLDNETNAVSNVALYQLYLMSDASSNGGTAKINKDDKVNSNWYNIVAYAAQDDYTWNKWTFNMGSAATKISTAGISLVTSVLGGIIIAIISFLAIMYYLISTILMALAPLFFLLAIHPGRGKRMFLGWLSQIAGNILKYLASALFLVVTVALYSAVLSNTGNIATTFIFVLILSAALFLYRGEIVNLIGRADMGGEKLSNSFAERAERLAKGGTKKVVGGALGMAGAAAGGIYATGKGASLGDYFKNANAGIKDNIKRDLKRKNGFIGNATRQAERVSNDNRRDLRDNASRAQNDATKFENQARTADAEYENAKVEHEETQQSIAQDQVKIDDLNARAEVHAEVEHKVLSDMSTDNPAYAKAQELLHRMEDINADRRIAAAAGNHEEASRLGGKYEEAREKYVEARADMNEYDYQRGDRRYTTQMKRGMQEAGVTYDRADKAEHLDTFERQAAAKQGLEGKQQRVDELDAQRNSARLKSDAARAHYESLKDTSDDWRPGETMTTGRVKKAQERAYADAHKAYTEAGGDVDEFRMDTGYSSPDKKNIKQADKRQRKSDKVEFKEAKAETKTLDKTEKYRDKRQAKNEKRASKNSPGEEKMIDNVKNAGSKDKNDDSSWGKDKK